MNTKIKIVAKQCQLRKRMHLFSCRVMVY